MNPIILIPARMASTRLPGKPLALIADEPMILHVWRLALAAQAGEVAVACDGQEIFDVITQAGGRAILTDAELPSGSDRIYQALQRLDPHGIHDVVINMQGDMPALEPRLITSAATLLENPMVDIGTLAAVITDEAEKKDIAVVKVVMGEGSWNMVNMLTGRALYFSRAAVPSGEGPLYHHIGIYAYRRDALERFVALPPSPLEQREKLEQLRALEAGMRIEVAVVDTVPLGVDTPEGLERVRNILENRNQK